MNQLGYLSGGPRVSTRAESDVAGPRAHVLGVIHAFESLGWEVKPFIVGDHVPKKWLTRGTEDSLRSKKSNRIFADIFRLFMGVVNPILAIFSIGNVDLVYERFAAFQSIGWIFQIFGIPWILETNAILFVEGVNDRKTINALVILKKMEIWAYKKCDYLVCVSNSLADLTCRETGVSPDKIIVIPNGVDTSYFNPKTVEVNRYFQEPTIGFVGELRDYQRLDLLIQALSILKREKMNYKLAIIGKGESLTRWQEYTKSVGVENDCIFVGHVPWGKIPYCISGFDLGYSGPVPLQIGEMYLSPLKIYEYLAMSRPILASDFEDANALINESHAGYLFQAGNLLDLCSVLREAYKGREKWSEMGNQGRELVLDKHSWITRIEYLLNQIRKTEG